MSQVLKDQVVWRGEERECQPHALSLKQRSRRLARPGACTGGWGRGRWPGPAARASDGAPGDRDLVCHAPSPIHTCGCQLHSGAQGTLTMVPGLQWYSLCFLTQPHVRLQALGHYRVLPRHHTGICDSNSSSVWPLLLRHSPRTPIWEMPTDPSCVSDSGTNPGKLPHRPQRPRKNVC